MSSFIYILIFIVQFLPQPIYCACSTNGNQLVSVSAVTHINALCAKMYKCFSASSSARVAAGGELNGRPWYEEGCSCSCALRAMHRCRLTFIFNVLVNTITAFKQSMSVHRNIMYISKKLRNARKCKKISHFYSVTRNIFSPLPHVI